MPYNPHLQDNYTPEQAEVMDFSPKVSFFALGTVTRCMDDEHAGRIEVDSPAFPEGPEQCDYLSPIGGAGYGFFAVPGIGATVLVGCVPYADPPNRYFWMGCLYAAGQEVQQDMKTQPYYRGDRDTQFNQITRVEVLEDGEDHIKGVHTCYGVPNADHAAVYGSNDLPDSFVLKHPGGHCLSMTDKRSDVEINEIKLKSAQNKRLILSDARPDAGGERIHLIDENENQIMIRSDDPENPDSICSYAGKNIEVTSKEGKMEHMIQDGTGDFTIDNCGEGNIDITAHQGSITIKSPKSIRLECGGTYIEITPDGIKIRTNNIDSVAGQGDSVIRGISAVHHVHAGVMNGPGATKPPL